MKTYIQLHFTDITEEKQEEVIALLDEMGSTGFEQNAKELIAFFEKENFDEEGMQAVIKVPFKIHEIEDQNWNAVWESNFQPVVVNTFCAIRAEFHQPITDVEHEIIITPKMSFGTGHHATTFMMIEQMKEIDFGNKTVFDFGTGTGILAILAKKLGAAHVEAIDVDDWSIENAKENFTCNGVDDIQLKLSSHIPDASFNVILANINRNVLVDNMKQLANAIVEDGCILMSGLLINDEQAIVEAAQTNELKLIRQTVKNNWICLLFVK